MLLAVSRTSVLPLWLLPWSVLKLIIIVSRIMVIILTLMTPTIGLSVIKASLLSILLIASKSILHWFVVILKVVALLTLPVLVWFIFKLIVVVMLRSIGLPEMIVFSFKPARVTILEWWTIVVTIPALLISSITRSIHVVFSSWTQVIFSFSASTSTISNYYLSLHKILPFRRVFTRPFLTLIYILFVFNRSLLNT